MLMGGTALLPSISSMGADSKKTDNKEGYNVIFIISDQHKLQVTGCYGNPVVKTPNIDELARNGVTFTRAYTPCPLSAPARAAITTGTYPSVNGSMLHKEIIEKNGKKTETEAGKHRQGYAEGMSTWGEYMLAKGYATAAFGKMHVHGELQDGVNADFPKGNHLGFEVSDMRFYTSYPGGHYKDWKNNPDYNARYREIQDYQYYFKGNNFNQALKPTLVQNEEDIFDFAVVSKFKDYVESRKGSSKPMFIHVGLEKPHKPWTTTRRFYDMYSLDDMKIPSTWRDWHDNGRYPYAKKGTHNPLTDTTEIKKSMLAYYACVTEMDENVGEIIAETKRTGIYDRTIFIYTTDHGEHLYEHGFHEKHNMFEDAVNVPLIISCPALLPKGVKCDAVASLLDVLPTISEMLGMKPDPQWEGVSLLSRINAPENWDRAVYSEFYQYDFLAFPKMNVPMRMCVDGKYKYAYTHGIFDQLYDASGNDPDEMTNLAFDPSYKDVIRQYKFKTIAGWKIPFAGLMDARLVKSGKNRSLVWKALPEAETYTIWASDVPDKDSAVLAGETEGLSFDLSGVRGKYFWVMADWKFSRFSERSSTIPMITKNYPETLPVSDMICKK